ncbi:hypothetical protein H312_01793 [Anncaliia algerae PRA339]|uniref:Uncharacterized protein n=1 Tax=Anncaliia algerae PRA339 TaxID=1288291 RepID=A0A059F1C7_9MICR|nr:hypothetical protein H312_01793 [Anncaliia algerae PRA339]
MLHIIFYLFIISKQAETLDNLVDRLYDALAERPEEAMNSVKSFIFLSSHIKDILTIAKFHIQMSYKESDELERLQKFICESLDDLPSIISKKISHKEAKSRWKIFWKAFQRNIKSKGKQYKHILKIIKTLEQNLDDWLKLNKSLKNSRTIGKAYSNYILRIFALGDEDYDGYADEFIMEISKNLCNKLESFKSAVINYKYINFTIYDFFWLQFVQNQNYLEGNDIFFFRTLNALINRSFTKSTKHTNLGKIIHFGKRLYINADKSVKDGSFDTDSNTKIHNFLLKKFTKMFDEILDELESMR